MKLAATLAVVLATVALGGTLLLTRQAQARAAAEAAYRSARETEARARGLEDEEPRADESPEEPGSLPPAVAEVRVEVETTARRVARLLADLDALLVLAGAEGPDREEAQRGIAAVRRRLQELEREQRRALAAARAEESARSRSSYLLAEDWVDRAKQLDDALQRVQAIEAIRVALTSGDPEQQLAALRALQQIGDVAFDKEPFREPVLAIARDARGATLVSALYALSANRLNRPEDIALALRAVDDEEAYGSALHLAFVYSGGQLVGEVGDAVLPLLDESRGAEPYRYLNGLWGAKVSPELAARLLEMSRTDHGYEAIYFGLSTLTDKSPAVVARLIEAVGGSDSQSSGRALWGLGHGVPEASWSTVAAAMRSFFDARSDAHSRGTALRLLSRYGGPADAPWLEDLRDNPNASREMRDAAAAALVAILGR